jgi:hypothetical protein
MSLDNFRRSNAPVNRVNINGVSNRRRHQNNQNNQRVRIRRVYHPNVSPVSDEITLNIFISQLFDGSSFY